MARVKGSDLSALTGAPNAAGNPAAYVRSDNLNSVVYRGYDNHVYELSLPLGAPAWQVADLSALTGAPNAALNPAAYVRSDNLNSVVYQGYSDNHVYELSLPFGAPTWQVADLSALTGAPQASDGDVPTAYRRSDNVNSVVYCGVDLHIHELFLPFGAPAWQLADLSALTGAESCR
jgi:hypothetical protein